jgi:uncharacterized membrane protein
MTTLKSILTILILVATVYVVMLSMSCTQHEREASISRELDFNRRQICVSFLAVYQTVKAKSDISMLRSGSGYGRVS